MLVEQFFMFASICSFVVSFSSLVVLICCFLFVAFLAFFVFLAFLLFLVFLVVVLLCSDLYEICYASGSSTLLSRGHWDGELHGLAPHPTNPNIVATSGDDTTVRVWDTSLHEMVSIANVEGTCFGGGWWWWFLLLCYSTAMLCFCYGCFQDIF